METSRSSSFRPKIHSVPFQCNVTSIHPYADSVDHTLQMLIGYIIQDVVNIARTLKRNTWKITAFICFHKILKQFVKTNYGDDPFSVLLNLSVNLGLSYIHAVTTSVQLCFTTSINTPFNIEKNHCY